MARGIHIVGWLLLGSWLWCPPVRAADVPPSQATPPQDNSSTVLTGVNRIPGLYVDEEPVPANVTVLTAQDIQDSGASSLPELFSRVEGFTVKDTQGFGLGTDGTVNLRGVATGSRTGILVLLDGVRQNRITGDEVHWQSMPLETIERIEIIRGGGGTIYGEGAFTGVINILTKQGGEKPLDTEAHAEWGSFGWQQYHAAARGRSYPFTYDLTYTRHFLDGYREFSFSRNTTITDSSGVELGDLGKLAVHMLHSADTTAFPGGLTAIQTEQDRRHADVNRRGIFDDETTQVSTDLTLGPWEGLSGVFNMFWRRRIADSFTSALDLFEITPSRGLSLRTNYDLALGAMNNSLIGGVELTDDKATTGTRGTSPVDESNRGGFGLYCEDTLTFWNRLSLVGGIRFDKSRYEEAISFPNFTGTLKFSGLSPKVGVTYALLPHGWDLFASFSRPFKAPNIDDFSGIVPDFVGNLSLKPQQANTYELGTRASHGPWNADLTWFYLDTKDEIIFNRLNGSFGQNENFDTRRAGVEMGGHLDWPEKGLRAHATYTFVKAEFSKGSLVGNTIPGAPEHLFNTGVGFSPMKNVWVDFDWQSVNDFYRINDVGNVLPKGRNYNVVNANLTYHISNIDVFVKFENILDEEYSSFASSNGLTTLGAGENPMPPFGVKGGLTVKF